MRYFLIFFFFTISSCFRPDAMHLRRVMENNMIEFTSGTSLSEIEGIFGKGESINTEWPIRVFYGNDGYVYWVGFIYKDNEKQLKNVVRFRENEYSKYGLKIGENVFGINNVMPEYYSGIFDIGVDEFIETWGFPIGVDYGFSRPKFLYKKSDGSMAYVEFLANKIYIS